MRMEEERRFLTLRSEFLLRLPWNCAWSYLLADTMLIRVIYVKIDAG